MFDYIRENVQEIIVALLLLGVVFLWVISRELREIKNLITRLGSRPADWR